MDEILMLILGELRGVQCNVGFGYQPSISFRTARKTLIEVAGLRTFRMRTDF
jgi:hypothetical protein